MYFPITKKVKGQNHIESAG